jgi:hypothetical protein
MPAAPKFAYFVSTVTVRHKPDSVNLVVLVFMCSVLCFLITQPSSFPLQRAVYKISSKMQRYYLSQCALPVKLQEWQIQPTSYESETSLLKRNLSFGLFFIVLMTKNV